MMRKKHFYKLKKEYIVQFVKFGIVGVSNTLISYGIDQLFFYFVLKKCLWNDAIKIFISSLIAFVVSVINSYYWNNKYVFSAGVKKSLKEHFVSFGKMVLCYGITGLLLSPVLKMLLSKVGVRYWITSVIALAISVPINYLLNKYWAFAKKCSVKEESQNEESLHHDSMFQ